MSAVPVCSSTCNAASPECVSDILICFRYSYVFQILLSCYVFPSCGRVVEWCEIKRNLWRSLVCYLGWKCKLGWPLWYRMNRDLASQKFFGFVLRWRVQNSDIFCHVHDHYRFLLENNGFGSVLRCFAQVQFGKIYLTFSELFWRWIPTISSKFLSQLPGPFQ